MMKRFLCLLAAIGCMSAVFAQTDNQQSVEVYATGGLFSTNLSNDSLVPPKGRKSSRLGDGAAFGFQYGKVSGKHILLKAGIGFSTREYSLVKYGIGDFIGAFFYFDSPPRRDSFPIARVQYKLHYIDFPFTIAYHKGRAGRNVQLAYGLTARLQVLTGKQATITPDAAASAATPPDIAAAQKEYAASANSVVISVEPYADLTFRVYKGIMVYYQVLPFSLYASPLDHRITTGEAEFLGAGIGISYQF